MKSLKLLSFVFGAVALAIIGCSKGSTGPQGPVGPAGPDSVIHSKWITLSMDLNVTTGGDSIYTQTIAAPAITQKILDSGIVLSYLMFQDNTNATNIVSAAPYFINEFFYPAAIDLVSFNDYSGLGYRYVLVPGTVVTGNVVSGPAKGLTIKQLKDMSYSAVVKLAGESSSGANSQ